MKVAVLKETLPGERRVALIPAGVKQLVRAGFEVFVESEAGQSAGFSDAEYADAGATAASADDCYASDILVRINTLGAYPDAAESELARLRRPQIVVGCCDPLGETATLQKAADTGVSVLALELIPRITRAQNMDVLSSMASIAGYRAVLLAATELPKIFPLMMTAAGTLRPARVFVIGAGVAGLQAIATAKRLGAVVSAYDVRPAVRDQVESVGGKFIELELEAGTSEDKGGYAKAMDEQFYEKQRALMTEIVQESDVVITTAAIPGRQSPLLVTAQAVEKMAAGSVIIDMAAQRGGNCELSQPDQRVVEHGVTILGSTNLPAEIPYHASQMFSSNVVNLLRHLAADQNSGSIEFDPDDEISAGTLATHDGQVVHPRLREILNLPPLEKTTSTTSDNPGEAPS